ncbi:MAG: fibronectin type III domain-containing protein [Patescibacteria group bacterium]|nr:fibronectin type III domain-containing protein [Patescibacteria group bacterium]
MNFHHFSQGSTTDLKISKIASIFIGLLIGIVLIIMAFRFFSTTFSRASDNEPRDVVISEITKNNAKISWTTAIETQGVVEYGTSPTATNYFAPETNPTKNHLVELTLLSPATTYYFFIRIGDKRYDNGGVPWTLTTKSEQESVRPTISSIVPTQILPSPTVIRPTPIQTIIIPQPSTNNALTCDETDCQKIKEKFGRGCNTQDYFKCLRRLTPTL